MPEGVAEHRFALWVRRGLFFAWRSSSRRLRPTSPRKRSMQHSCSLHEAALVFSLSAKRAVEEEIP
jgi:hypothetical protein